MYGTINNGEFIAAPRMLIYTNADGKQLQVFNPSDRLLAELGYLQKVETPYPEIVEGNTTTYVSHYEEIDGKAVQLWAEFIPDAEAVRVERIAEIRRILYAYDYKTSKREDGNYTAEEWAAISAERNALRAELNELEAPNVLEE